MSKYDDAIDALRAADPAKRFPAPDPDSPEARALFNDIIAQPRWLPDEDKPYRRRRVVTIVAVALLTLLLIAVAWLTLRDVSNPISVACYQSTSLDSNIADAPSRGALDPDLCRSVWEDGRLANTDIVPAGQVPPLIACVTDEGNLAVFPTSNTALCSSLGLAEPNPESIPDADAVRLLNEDLFTYFDQQDCRPMEQATRDVRRILNKHGLNNWQVETSPGTPERPCASYALDAPTQILRLVPIPPPTS
ncbi:hypothetical protein MNBD_ACTINO02-1324 [hydrothermal vent metagenome]|uniref:Uncharacterized protein n=1 Tax=hydrothermal vent metagenome TaxID=652676 RepID=A0A3B0T2U7_9ZZZZ